MTHGRKTLLCLVGGLSACSLTISAWGNTGDNPYKTIVDRNVFGLKPPPPPGPGPGTENTTPPPKITLTGITTILGNKRALMKTPPAAVKPGEQPREQSYILSEGQRDGDLEVVQIDEKTGSVKLMYAGTPVTLTFEKDGPKTAPGGLPAPTGMVPGRPFPGTDGGIRTLPTRTMRAGAPNAMVQPAAYQPAQGGFQPSVSATSGSSTTSGTSSSQNSGAYQSAALTSSGTPQYTDGYQYSSGGGTPTSVNLGGYGGQKSFTPWPPEDNVNAEQAAVLMELNRQKLRANGDPLADMIPRTSLTPNQPQQQTGNQSMQGQNNPGPIQGLPSNLQPPGF